MTMHVPNQFRLRKGYMGSDDSIGNNGAFIIPVALDQAPLAVIASDGRMARPRWEHVSVSLPDRCPTWPEMCAIKDLFWDEGDLVVQFHPPKSQHVNNHEFCLHLWRPIDRVISLPPSWTVGYKELGVLR